MMIRTMVAIGMTSVLCASLTFSEERQAVREQAPKPHSEVAQPAQPEVVIEGIENLEPEIAARLLEAARELLPRIEAHSDEVVERPLVGGLDDIWITDPDIARHLEAVAREIVLGGLELGNKEGNLTIVDREKGLSFRVDGDNKIDLVVMHWGEDSMLHTNMAATIHLPYTEIKVLDGKAQVNMDDAQGTVAAAQPGTCAATPNGVCCNFTNGDQVRIVCMCQRGSMGASYELCGDTGWLK